jgi:UDP-glucose:(heptosyl)LPS alpha-1,3-glucosyltransferase
VKVALAVHHVRPTGGQDRYALELARRLASDVELELIAMRAEDVPAGVTVRRVRPRVGPMLLRAEVFRRAAGRLVAAGGYDLVHTVGGALPGADVLTAQFCHAAWARACPPASAYQRLVVRRAAADERRAFRHPNLRAVIAVSRRTAEDVAEHYGPLAHTPTVIPNGVDLEAFTPVARPSLDGRPARLLFVGAFARKGLDVAIRALAAMRRSASLCAVGEGPHAAYRRLAHQLGVADRVRLEPPRHDIATAYREADAFVFPTRYEPFGMVIAEAMATGLAVVTSRVAGAAELIADGVSGRVVADPEDWAAFAAALDAVLANDATREAAGRAAREAVRAVTWDRVAAETLAVWRAAVSRS